MINVSISKRVFNDRYLPLLNSDARYLVLYGGAGSGKSYFIAERYIYKLLTSKLCNLLVVRNTARSNRDSTFALLKQVITNWNMNKLFTINSGDLRIKCINGNEVIFNGLDDVEKLKSVTFASGELTDIWVEEASEVLEPDFNQLDVRLRGGKSKKQIVISFNPIDINHWLKKKFIDVKKDNIVVMHSTYQDNRFLDAEYKRLLESYKDTDPYYYNVYCLGQWGVLGKTIFDAEKVSNRLAELKGAIQRGLFEYRDKDFTISDISFREAVNGYINIYEKPQQDHYYVIGGDTAGEGSDYFVGQVIDADTGKQVAVLRHQMDADLYAKQIYCLGKMYNDALLVIEMNFDSYPLRELERLGYRNMFVREQQDTFTGAFKKAYGFRTDSISRPRIISQLVEIVREHTELFYDKETLEEMLTFVRNEKGRAEAQEGAHDDLVMAMAIAHDGISQVKRKHIYDETPDDDLEIYEMGWN